MPDTPICPIMSRPVPHMPNPDVEFHTGAVAWVPCIGSRCMAWIPEFNPPLPEGVALRGSCAMMARLGNQFEDPAQPEGDCP